MSHAASGIQMLRELPGNDHPERCPPKTLEVSGSPVVPYDTLQVLFARFHTQMIQLDFVAGPASFHACEETEPGFADVIPLKFSTLLEARNSMDYQEQIQSWFFNMIDRNLVVKATLEEERRNLLNKMYRWQTAFDNFIRASPTLARNDNHASKILKIRYLVSVNSLFMANHRDDMKWDGYNETFSGILDLASDIIEGSATLHTLNGKRTPTFSLDQGFTAPLFKVARSCRDPIIRRRAINLLLMAPRQEGVFDGVLAAKVAERLVALEEEGQGEVTTAADIPRDARIVVLNVQWDLLERRARMIYSRQLKTSETLEVKREVISW